MPPMDWRLDDPLMMSLKLLRNEMMIGSVSLLLVGIYHNFVVEPQVTIWILYPYYPYPYYYCLSIDCVDVKKKLTEVSPRPKLHSLVNSFPMLLLILMMSLRD